MSTNNYLLAKIWSPILTFISVPEISSTLFLTSKFHLTLSLTRLSQHPLRPGDDGTQLKELTPLLCQLHHQLITFTTTRIHKFANILPESSPMVPWQQQFIQLNKGTLNIAKNKHGKRILIIENSGIDIRGWQPPPKNTTVQQRKRSLLRSSTEESKTESTELSMTKTDTETTSLMSTKTPDRKNNTLGLHVETKLETKNEDSLITPTRPLLVSNATPFIDRATTNLTIPTAAEIASFAAFTAAKTNGNESKKGNLKKTTASTSSSDSKEEEKNETMPNTETSNTNSMEVSDWQTMLKGSIYVWSKSNDIRFTNLSLTNTNGYGLFVQEGSQVIIANSEICHCGFDAVLTHGESTTLTMIGCSVHHNEGCGIWSDEISEITIRGNTRIHSNNGIGISCQEGSRISLESGSCLSNTSVGIQVDKAGVVRIHDGFLLRNNGKGDTAPIATSQTNKKKMKMKKKSKKKGQETTSVTDDVMTTLGQDMETRVLNDGRILRGEEEDKGPLGVGPYQLHARIYCQWQQVDGPWYPGRIVGIDRRGKFVISYDDGDRDENVTVDRLRTVDKYRKEKSQRMMALAEREASENASNDNQGTSGYARYRRSQNKRVVEEEDDDQPPLDDEDMPVLFENDVRNSSSSSLRSASTSNSNSSSGFSFGTTTPSAREIEEAETRAMHAFAVQMNQTMNNEDSSSSSSSTNSSTNNGNGGNGGEVGMDVLLQCGVCTYINGPGSSRCMMCGSGGLTPMVNEIEEDRDTRDTSPLPESVPDCPTSESDQEKDGMPELVKETEAAENNVASSEVLNEVSNAGVDLSVTEASGASSVSEGNGVESVAEVTEVVDTSAVSETKENVTDTSTATVADNTPTATTVDAVNDAAVDTAVDAAVVVDANTVDGGVEGVEENEVQGELSDNDIQNVMDASGRSRNVAIRALKAYGSVVDSVMALTLQ